MHRSVIILFLFVEFITYKQGKLLKTGLKYVGVPVRSWIYVICGGTLSAQASGMRPYWNELIVALSGIKTNDFKYFIREIKKNGVKERNRKC